MLTEHQKFVQLTEQVLLDDLPYSSTLPVGNWLTGIKRPDVLILQKSARGMTSGNKLHLWMGSHDNVFIVECKIKENDVRNSVFQLMMAMCGFRGRKIIDLHHGGIRPALAVSSKLKEILKEKELLETFIQVYEELHFSIVVIEENKTTDWIVWGDDTFYGND